LVDLDSIEQIVEVDDEKQRYSIDDQIEDLLDSLLEKLPNIDRTPTEMKRIQLYINRYKQLRDKISIFDKNNNVVDFKKYNDNRKPIVESLLEFNSVFKYIVKIVGKKKKIYDYTIIKTNI